MGLRYLEEGKHSQVSSKFKVTFFLRLFVESGYKEKGILTRLGIQRLEFKDAERVET